MAERSFKKEVEALRLGAGQEFRGEGILAVTKALLQSGVSYVAGYQGAPISHLMDVLADAQDILDELGVHFESSASEAAAAATLAASVNYPLRGAVTWKSTAGTNVASDALSNLSSGGVTGGALIVIGEDYGEGSSIMQERTHAFAMKSQLWLLDPRPSLPVIVRMVEQGFALSEASRTPVMLELRIRACHLHGRFAAKDNVRPAFTLKDAMERPSRDVGRIVLPPASYAQEQEKIRERLPAARRFIAAHGMNEIFSDKSAGVGIILQGGMYNGVIRALQLMGLSDAFGNSRIPLYVLNVTYPLLDDEVQGFCGGKRAVLMVEEGQPDFLEQAVNTILRKGDLQTRVHGKDMLPMAGEYTATVLRGGLEAFVGAYLPAAAPQHRPAIALDTARSGRQVHPRPPSFCTGCPERPIFTAMKLVERELGPHHVSCDIGCHLFSILPPFNIGATTMGYGLGWAGAAALNAKDANRRTISVMGDGGFWHNGIASSVGNAVFNKSDNVLLVVDNFYSAATGGQDLLSSRAKTPQRATNNAIARAVRGVGVKWVRQITRTYDVARMRDVLREALTTKQNGPKVIIASSECMLNRQRRVRPAMAKAVSAGKRVVRERFGVDPDTCTGDHSCIRLSGCPSLTVRPNPDRTARRPDCACGTELCRMRLVWRGGACRCSLPVLLPRGDRQQSESLGSAARARQRRRNRRDAIADASADCAPCRLKRRCPAWSARHDRKHAPSAWPFWRWAAKAAACWRTGWLIWPSMKASLHKQPRFPASHSVPARRSITSRCFRRARDQQEPVLALMPTPGDVDLVIASELMEAGRAVQRGLVTPDRTTFVFSTHRVFAMTEKTAMADGRADVTKLLDTCRKAAYRAVAADMQRLAEENRSVISAVLLGAVAGSGALPFARAGYEEAIRRAGVGVAASLAAFGAGFAAAASGIAVPESTGAQRIAAQPAPVEGFPPRAATLVAEGMRRLTDYQDADYASLYLQRLRPIAALDAAHGDGSARLIAACARYLALWMSYEDTIRVADLKIRAERFARIRTEARAQSGQVLRIREFLHPRVQEIAETLPAGIGRRLLRPGLTNRLVARLTARGRRIQTTSVPGFLLLWTVAALRRWRRNTLRYTLEQSRIDGWLARITAIAASDYALATEIALCQRLVKGYGDTHERGLARYERLMRAADALRGEVQAATRLAALRDAALADETGQSLDRALAEQDVTA